MTQRQRLANRRAAETFSFAVGGLQFTCTVRLGEVFIDSNKGGSGAAINARDAAIAVSFALQHGADLATIRRALCRDSQGRPSGPLSAALDRINEVEP